MDRYVIRTGRSKPNNSTATTATAGEVGSSQNTRTECNLKKPSKESHRKDKVTDEVELGIIQTDEEEINDRNINEDEHQNKSVIEKKSSETTKDKRRIQQFRPVWLDKFNWVMQIDKRPFCKICNRLLTNNINHIVRHESTSSHIKKMDSLKNQPEITENEKTSDYGTLIKQGKAAEIKIIMFLMEHNLPFTLVEGLIKLVKSIVPDSKISKHLKVGKTKAAETVTTLLHDEGIGELSNILRNQKFSLIIDETTDISTSKCLAVIARYYNHNSGKVIDRFFNMIQLKNCDSKSIYDALLNLFKCNNIPISNLIGFAADHASVMMGQKNGVQKLLLQHNSSLYVIGCTCHSLHLCSSAAAKKLPQNVEILARNIYVFFAHSAKRQTEFLDFQEFFNVKVHKILKTSLTRWLALENVVTRILEQWVPLKHYFISFQLDNNDLAHKISVEMTESSKLYFYFLAYILKLTNDINKEFQAQSPRMHLLLPTIETYMKTILTNFLKAEIIDSNYNINDMDFSKKDLFLHLDDVYLGGNAEIMIKSGCIENLKIQEIKAHCVGYYVELCQQVFKRINFKDQRLIALKGLNPQSLAKSVTTLSSCFPNLISLENVFEIESLDKEWRTLLNYTAIDKSLDLEEFWDCVFKTKNGLKENMFPNLKEFVGSILCLPHSSATAERVFSQLNLLKDKKRNRLLVPTINSIMIAKDILNGSTSSDWVPSSNVIKKYHKI